MKTFDALSPLDGRYAPKLDELRPIFSEFGLVKRRVEVEIAWLIALCKEDGIPEATASEDECRALREIAEQFTEADARGVKAIEAKTNHDVKAVEYFIQEKLTGISLESLRPFVHFACTSDDINNVAYALMLRDGLAVLRTAQNELTEKLTAFAIENRDVAMLAHTHGKPASPTTFGKEMAVFVHRLNRQSAQLDAIQLPAKMNGAVGCYNAHVVAYPNVDWEALSKRVIEGFGLTQNVLTTQIEPHDGMAELFDALCRWNTVLLDLNRDIWTYISMVYLKQKIIKGEVGSSAMPHKVNPIDFENSEGNLGLANAVLGHMARKLPVSRLQRDLTDSTVLRNIGVGFGYSLVAYQSTLKGLGKIVVNESCLEKDLNQEWEVLAEAVQTILRKHGSYKAYDLLKRLTRGKLRMSTKRFRDRVVVISKIANLPDEVRDDLLALTPSTYVGLASKLVK